MDFDAQLLDRYARTRDAQAFTQMVRRHAGMVFAVARRVTRDHHDAQDVAQRCFMELARQPGAIHGSLAGWLHAVATTRAAESNRAAARRHRHEQAAARPEPQTQPTWDDIAPIVDEALAQLPEELRLPVVLYHLEGRKQRQIAAELGVNTSTVSRRVEAGVEALRQKLKLAGITTPSAALPTLLTAHALEAAPKTLVAELGRLAISGVVPTPGAAASTGAASTAVKSTAMAGLKIFVGVVLTAAATAAGVAMLPAQQPTTAPAATTTATTAPSMTTQLNQIIARITAETAQGLGDGVAILPHTRANVNHPSSASAKPLTLRVYALQGQSRLYIEMDSYHKSQWGNPSAKLPEGWPLSTLEEMLRFVDQIPPYDLVATDGQVRWRAGWKDPHTVSVSSSPEQPGERPLPNPTWDYSWPEPADLKAAASGGRQGSIELLHRADNPDIFGLHGILYRQLPHKTASVPQYEFTYWLDQSRNDVPVEESFQNYDKRGRKTSSYVRRDYEYAQLPNAQWYPRHFHRFDNGEKASCLDCWLIFLPGQTLDARWFADPTPRFAGFKVVKEGVASKAVAAVTVAVTAATTTVARSAWWWWPWVLALSVFAVAGLLLLQQRRAQATPRPLRGHQGRR